MADHSYPGSLPSWAVEGHIHGAVGITEDVEWEQGEDRARQIYTWVPQIAAVTTYLDQAQFDRFDAWYENDLEAGTNRFNVPVAGRGGANEQWWVAQFIGPYSWEAINAHVFRVSAQLLLVDGPNAARIVELLQGVSFVTTTLQASDWADASLHGAMPTVTTLTGQVNAAGLIAHGASSVTTILTGEPLVVESLLLESGDDLLLEDGGLVLLEGGGGGGGGGGVIVAALTASRTSGPAPLSVVFDAIGTTEIGGADTFRSVDYTFDYGDTSGRTGGPLGGVVYETPGTYNVSVSATDGTHTDTAATVTITVQDPDVVYAGTDTVVISTSGTFSGAPAGATQVTGAAPLSWSSDKRYLFRRGETFDAISLAPTLSNIQIGAFGSGAKPRINGTLHVGSLSNPASYGGVFIDTVTIMDVRCDRTSLNVCGSRVTWLRVDVEAAPPAHDGAAFEVAAANSYYMETFPSSAVYRTSRECHVIDCTAFADYAGTLTMAGAWGEYGMVLGNTFTTTGPAEHNLRVYTAYKTFISGNTLEGRLTRGTDPIGRHSLKLQSGGLNTTYPSDDVIDASSQLATRYVVVADNTIGSASDTNDWQLTAAPQNTGESEGVEDVIVENNDFTEAPATQVNILAVGRRITQRNNTTTGDHVLAIDDGHGSPWSLPEEWLGPNYGFEES